MPESPAALEPDTRKVRAWAAQAGIALSSRGPIPTEVRGGVGPRLPLLPAYRDLSLLVRTDFSDDTAWNAITAAIGEPTREGFVAYVDTCDDHAYADLPTSQLIEHLPNGTTSRQHPVLFVVDRHTIQDPEHPLIAVDAREAPTREFRLIPSAVQVVADSMNAHTMRFESFMHQADADGVFRHY